MPNLGKNIIERAIGIPIKIINTSKLKVSPNLKLPKVNNTVNKANRMVSKTGEILAGDVKSNFIEPP